MTIVVDNSVHTSGVDLHIKRYCFSYGIGCVSGFTFYIGVQVRREAATVPDIRPIYRVPRDLSVSQCRDSIAAPKVCRSARGLSDADTTDRQSRVEEL